MTLKQIEQIVKHIDRGEIENGEIDIAVNVHDCEYGGRVMATTHCLTLKHSQTEGDQDVVELEIDVLLERNELPDGMFGIKKVAK